jgi:hypothetical protein
MGNPTRREGLTQDTGPEALFSPSPEAVYSTLSIRRDSMDSVRIRLLSVTPYRCLTLLLLALAFGLVAPTRAQEETPPAAEETAPAAAEETPPAAQMTSTAEIEPNNSASDATEVPFNADITATVSAKGDRDHFRIRTPAPMHLSIEVTGVEGVDFRVRLIDIDRHVLIELNGQPAGAGEEFVQRVRRDTLLLDVTASVAEPLPADAAYVIKIRRARLLEYAPPIEEIKAAIARGLDHLAASQEEDGSWDVNIGDHGVAGLALMGFLAEKRKSDGGVIDKAANLFRAVYVPPEKYEEGTRNWFLRGGLLAPFGGHTMYEHAIGVLAMSEYLHHGHGREGDREMVEAGVRFLVRSQATGRRPKEMGGPFSKKSEHFGGWRYRPQDRTSDLSASGWCLIALFAAETAGFVIPEEVRKDYMAYCRSCFDEPTGTYRYTPGKGHLTNTTNAIGVLTTLMCMGGECPVVRRALKTIRTNLPAWEDEGRRGRNPFYYWYYASRAMYMAGGDYWKSWRAVMCPMLLTHQNEDGSWDAVLSEEKVGVPYTTALGVLILQLMSGNPPAYLKGLALTDEKYPCPRCVDDIEDLVRAAHRDRSTKEDVLRRIQEIIDRYRGE